MWAPADENRRGEGNVNKMNKTKNDISRENIII